MRAIDRREPTPIRDARNDSLEGHEDWQLLSFGSATEGLKGSFREALLWSLLLVSGCRPPFVDSPPLLDQKPERAIPTARFDSGAESAIHGIHNPLTSIIKEKERFDGHHGAHSYPQKASPAAYDDRWNEFVDRYESLIVKDLHDGIALESMMLTEAQIADLLTNLPTQNTPQEDARIVLLYQSAVDKGYIQADRAEQAYHTYLYIKARALCTDMLEVQLAGYQPYLSERAVPMASTSTERSDDPIADMLKLLNSMSEAILLKANERGEVAQQAASATHPGTVMARDLSRMLVDPHSIGDRARGDLESMAGVTLHTYCRVTNDNQVAPLFSEALKHALDAALARRAGLSAERLQLDESEMREHVQRTNLLMHFDVNGDGIVTRSELTPLQARYSSELVEALNGRQVPKSLGGSSHEGDH